MSEEELKEALELLKALYDWFDRPSRANTALYRTQAESLREQADRLEEKDKLLYRVKRFLLLQERKNDPKNRA